MEGYRTVGAYARAEFVERKSRFIGHIAPACTEAEALAFVERISREHRDATHNVYAYIIRGGATRYSDDGEPQGTAGMPVLDVLRREEVYNVTCVVTRYFGGILLGAGGLVRAYAKAAKLGLDAAGISIQRVWNRYRLDCPYRLFEQVKLLVAAQEGLVADTQFGAEITLTLLLPEGKAETFTQKLTDLTGGQLQPQLLQQEYRAFPVKNS